METGVSPSRGEIPKRFSRKMPLTPAWVVHRQGLSDKTPPEGMARQQRLRKSEAVFRKWHEECQKRKQRREVIVAKKLKPGQGEAGKSPSQRKPRSRLRCP